MHVEGAVQLSSPVVERTCRGWRREGRRGRSGGRRQVDGRRGAAGQHGGWEDGTGGM